MLPMDELGECIEYIMTRGPKYDLQEHVLEILQLTIDRQLTKKFKHILEINKTKTEEKLFKKEKGGNAYHTTFVFYGTQVGFVTYSVKFIKTDEFIENRDNVVYQVSMTDD